MAFLNDVLQPESPILAVRVLNPDIPKAFATERASILDVRVMLADRRRVNVEMQAQKKHAYRARLLYYWARNFGEQLEKGEDYQKLAVCAGIYVLDYCDLEGPWFHSTFGVCNPRTGEVFSDMLRLHFLELPKLEMERQRDPANKWGKFFRVTTEQELEELAMAEPGMRDAADALRWVSNDEKARQLALDREMSDVAFRHTIAAEREDARAEGILQGGARLLERLLVAKFGELPSEVKLRLESASNDDIERWAERVLDADRIEAVFDE